MAPSLPIQSTIAAASPLHQVDLEHGDGESAKASTTSVDTYPGQISDTAPMIGSGQAGSDVAAKIVASVWTRPQLILAYALLWFAILVSSLFANVTDALSPYVASAFNLHSYAAATGIVASVIAALSPVPTARFVRKWGRARGMLFMLVIYLIGLVMITLCQNVATLSAAQVFTAVGSTGINYCITVWIADTTALRDRGFLMSFSNSPDIITMWVAGPMASSLLTGIGWRWGYGIFAILFPFVIMPFIGLVLWNERKAHRTGLLQNSQDAKSVEKTTIWNGLKKFVVQTDLLGLFMLACGLSLFLLPFTLYSFQGRGFASPLITGFIVAGVILVIAYTVYERYGAPIQSIPFVVICERTTLLALVNIALSIIAFCNIVGYGSSWLQVVTGLTITQTSYIVSSIKVIMCVGGLLTGALIRWTGRLKLLSLTLGSPPMIVAAGIFLGYLDPTSNQLGLMVAVVLLSSLALGNMTLCASLAMMAALGEEHNTTNIALIAFITNVAPAIGEAINTAIWTGTFKHALHQHLPSLTELEIKTIYSSLDVQLSFPAGSIVRNGIASAYGDAKYYMLTVSLCLMAVAFVSTLFWRNLRVKGTEQTARKADDSPIDDRPRDSV